MRIRLYFDEDSGRHSLAAQLRARGTDVITTPEAGMRGSTDEEQLQWAALNGRVLYSFNRGHFYHLHTTWISQNRTHSGIILSVQEVSIGQQLRCLLRLASALTARDMTNRIEFLSAWA